MPYLVEPVVDPASVADHQPDIAAGDLVLRPWEGSDATLLVEAFGDPEIQRWHLRRLDSGDEADDLIRDWRAGWQQRTSASWAVTLGAADVVGQVGFRSLYLADGLAEVSYWVLPGWRHKGIAGRATAALADWALGELQLERLELLHSDRNTPSCRVADRAGFELEATLRRLQLHADGWHDMHLHSRLRGTPG